MAVPKQKTSKAKRDSRRAHDALPAPTRSRCPQCEAPKLPHRICSACGTYRDRKVIRGEED
ncbi:MAG: 50S ribosomal protein L32 [Myxococcota bacterium]|jgi:large subunit ribosomal protein L32